MRYEYFRGVDKELSAVAVGTWPMGAAGYGEVNDKDCIDAIHTMFDNGVNVIDTAPDYGVGYSETIVGKAIKGYRDKILLATKCCASRLTIKAIRTEVRYARDGRYENVLYECEQSLRRLGTDYIDFYFVHWPDLETSFAETMEAMNVLKKQGKIRFVGLSNFNKEQILECEKVCKIDAIQPPYSMVVRRDEDLLKWAAQRGTLTFTYGSLGAGILSGSFREVPTFGPRDPRNRFYPFFKEPWFSKIMKVVEAMDKIAAETGKTVPQIAINWQTQKNYVSTALCGVRNPAEAKEICSAFEWTLTDEQIKAIDDAIAANIDFDGADKTI